MEARAGGPRRDPERLRDLVERQTRVVVEDDDRTLVHRQAPEPSFELVAIGDDPEMIHGDGLDLLRKADGWHPAMAPPDLAVAGIDERPVRPGVELLRFAQARQVGPDPHHRLLGGILREMRIAQDRVGDPVEPRIERGGQRSERHPVPVLRPDHEIGVHAPPGDADRVLRCVRRIRPSQGMTRDRVGSCPSSLDMVLRTRPHAGSAPICM